MALFWQHPKLWARSLLKRVRDSILAGDEATAFIITELHNEILLSIRKASNTTKTLAELRSRIEITRDELEDLVASETALSAGESKKLRDRLVGLAGELGKVLDKLVDKVE